MHRKGGMPGTIIVRGKKVGLAVEDVDARVANALMRNDGVIGPCAPGEQRAKGNPKKGPNQKFFYHDTSCIAA